MIPVTVVTSNGFVAKYARVGFKLECTMSKRMIIPTLIIYATRSAMELPDRTEKRAWMVRPNFDKTQKANVIFCQYTFEFCQ